MENKNIILVIISIIAVVLLFRYGNLGLFSISGRQIFSTSTDLISEDSTGATYSFGFSYDPLPSSSDCNVQSSESFDINVLTLQSDSSLPAFVEGLKENIETETKQVIISGVGGIINICSASEREATIIFNNTKAICKISKGTMINQIPRANINCRFIGDIIPYENGQPVSAKIYGLTGGTATIKFLKEGIECKTPADTNCNNIVDREELGIYINSWVAGSVTRDNLGQAIVAWTGG